MNSYQMMAQQLAKKWLDSVEDEVFYAEYQELENTVGPTISSYKLDAYSSMSKTIAIDYSSYHTEFRNFSSFLQFDISFQDNSEIECANDKNYASAA